MRFKPARLESCATIVTVVTTVLLTAMAAWLAFKMPSPAGLISAAALLALIIGCYLWSVKDFRREGDNLIIEKMIGTKTVISFKDMEHALVIDNFTALKPMRVFGNGGLFGYYGIFSTAEHGHISCHLTRLRRIVLIRAKGRLYAVSPQDEQRFMEMVTSCAPSVDQRPETLPTIQAEARRYANPLILSVPAMFLAISILLAVLLYPKLPPVVATHFNGQGVPDGWSTRQSFLILSLLPGVIMFLINALVLFAIRRRIPDPRVIYFIIGLFSFMQLFFAFIILDIYAYSTRQSHILPLPYLLYIFFGIIAIGFFFYYRMVRRPQ